MITRSTRNYGFPFNEKRLAMTPKQIFQQEHGLARCISRVRNENGAKQYCVVDPSDGELGRWRDSAVKAWVSACVIAGLTDSFGNPRRSSKPREVA